jgi:hypothetical protein
MPDPAIQCGHCASFLGVPGRNAVTENAARLIYEGARLTIAEQDWSLCVDGIAAHASSSEYRLFFHVTMADRRIDDLAVYVETPETWPAARVLDAVQEALALGWTPEHEALVLSDEAHRLRPHSAKPVR